MGKTTMKKPPPFVSALDVALKKVAADAGVSIEHIRANRYRFIVVSKKFTNMGHPERQRLVWSIAEKIVPPANIFDVGMILAIAPSEI